MTDGWHEFFVATAGAAAALAGLIIVAMSVNIATIIAIPAMPARAASTIASLILTVVVGSAALIPGQPDVLLGLEVVLAAAVAAWLYIDAGVRILRFRGDRPRGETVVKAVFGPVQIAPYLCGGVLLLLGDPAGLGWIAAGVLLVFVGSVVNAWVMLVEILR